VKSAYANVNILNTQPSCTVLRLSSARMAGAAAEMQTRSTKVMIDSAKANRSKVKRDRVEFAIQSDTVS
jgi:hypothetical protein